MKRQWATYFKSLGMSRVLINRAAQASQALSNISQEDIQDVFVSEYINQDGIREFEHLYFFTPSQIIRATRFAVDDILDADALHQLRNLVTHRTHYDFEKANDKSRLTVKYTTVTACSAELKASQENCLTLTRILRERLVPLLRPQPSNPVDE